MPKTPNQLIAVCVTHAVCPSTDAKAELKMRLAKCQWEDLAEDSRLNASYGVAALEVGSGGLIHVQAYLELNKKLRFDRLKRLLPLGCHIEKRHGCAEDAADYCKKGAQTHAEWSIDKTAGRHYGDDLDLIIEFGEMKVSARGKRNDIELVRDAIMTEGSITNEIDLALRISSYQAWNLGKDLLRLAPVAAMRPSPTIYWLHGPTGSGKSYAAASFCEQIKERRGWQYWQSTGSLQWFDGYCRQEVAWFDDFRFEGKRTDFAMLLKLFDRYTFRVPVKGGYTIWCPRVILITAPKPVAESFTSISEKEDIGQMERRITREFPFAVPVARGRPGGSGARPPTYGPGLEQLLGVMELHLEDAQPKTNLHEINVENEVAPDEEE